MSSEKWSIQPTKAVPVVADTLLGIDSVDAQSKQMSISSILSIQTINSLVIVRSEADFPDALDAIVNDVSDSSGSPQFNFTLPHGYKEGDTVRIVGNATKVYDGFFVISSVLLNSFVITLLSFSVTDNGTATRSLKNDTSYQLHAPIVTSRGYIMPDASNVTFDAVADEENTLTITGTGNTVFTQRDAGTFVIRGLQMIDAGTNRAFDVTKNGTALPINGAFVFRNSTLIGIDDIGIVTGVPMVLRELGAIGWNHGFVATNVSGVFHDALTVGFNPGSSFLTINNRHANGADFTITLINPVLGPGVSLVDINPVAPLTNTVVMANGSANISGGTFFKPGANQASGVITAFDVIGPNTQVTSTAHGLAVGQIVTIKSATGTYDGIFTILAVPNANNYDINITRTVADTGSWTRDVEGSITNFTGSDGDSPVTVTSNAHGLVNGQFVDIANTASYNGRFVVSNVTTNTFEITIKFLLGTLGITGFTDSATSPGVKTTVTCATAHKLFDGQTIVISATTNYDDSYVISNITPLTFDIIKVLNGTETGTWTVDYTGATWIRVRTIATIVNLANQVITGTQTYSDAGDGRVRVNQASLNAEFIDNRNVTITGTTGSVYDGTFPIFNVLAGSFDIDVPFNGAVTSGGTVTLQLVTVTINQHDLKKGEQVSVSGTVSSDGPGGIVGAVTVNTFSLDKTYIQDESQGLIKTGSLDQRSLNIVLNGINGELNSKAKGSLSITQNTKPTQTGATVGVFFDIELELAKVKQSLDTERWVVSNKAKAEFKYIGLEPFSGDMVMAMQVTKESTGNNTRKYVLRAIKNNGIMVDNSLTNFQVTGNDNTVSVSVPFIVSVSAVTGDTFRLQVANQIGSSVDDPTFGELTIVNQ